MMTNTYTDVEHFLNDHPEITEESEKLFLREFLYPMIGAKGLHYVTPQSRFIDSSGKLRKIDFTIEKDGFRLAIEIDGEGYHSEGFISSNQYDDNLYRQNEIIRNGWHLLRFSYNQLMDSYWRKIVTTILREEIIHNIPDLLGEFLIEPTPLQRNALYYLDYYRSHAKWERGIIVLPTGTGKTYLSAMDARRHDGRVLFIVHRLDILKQSMNAYNTIWPEAEKGILTGEVKENLGAQILFASKDTLYQDEVLNNFKSSEFDYIVVDEVHHGQSPTYQKILQYFHPKFMLGMTATPDRGDRKDIFELFYYNKVYEVTIYDAIEQGYLVPFTYYGLHDNIDYSSIRYNGHRYSVQDLERSLIIPKRNEAIFREYLEKGEGNKAIGFCVSIEHTERMAEFFNNRGVSAVPIHSQSEKRDELIDDFRNNKYQVAFTVDLFNEGIDFPNVRVLLFLRPTESKTIFLQQLGRGLRLCPGKDRVVVMDFIGNYRKANHIRKFLAKQVITKSSNETGEKIVYEYASGCEVHFDIEVEELFRHQDEAERDVTADDLREAYFEVAEQLGRKPTQDDLNEYGRYKIAKYLNIFGSWTKFLRDIGEYTEASYHYPQGVHLGHVLYLVRVLGSGKREGSLIDDQYLRIRGGLDSGRLGHLQRQTKYKVQALMELGLVPDDRDFGSDDVYELYLTEKGRCLYEILNPLFSKLDLSFKEGKHDLPSWSMKKPPSYFNERMYSYLKENPIKLNQVRKIFIKMNAVAQMLNYLYRVERSKVVAKDRIYKGFFGAPFVKQFCDQHGIDPATDEASRRRCPFLLNILEALGLISQSTNSIIVNLFLITDETMRMHCKETPERCKKRAIAVLEAWPDKEDRFDPEELSLLREAFGKDFLTNLFFLCDVVYLE